jgi:predicted nucleic acid-binding protein
MVLVDTSVWVSHLRSGEPRLGSLLEEGKVVLHPFIVGELACGYLTNRLEILSLLRALPETVLATHDEVIRFIEDQHLMGRGLGYIDVHILAAARLTGVPLWTEDRQLKAAAVRLQVDYRER